MAEVSEIRDALSAVESAAGPELGDVLLLVQATLDGESQLAPPPLCDAVVAKWASDGDFANGGADQFVWNQGSPLARQTAAAFRAVGAVENADLLDHLAAQLDAYLAELGPVDEPVRQFLGYRKRVGGPFFRIPDPDEELAEALVDFAADHAAEFQLNK
jgi:hypothetical protein